MDRRLNPGRARLLSKKGLNPGRARLLSMYGFTAAGTVTDSNGIPFSFHRQCRLMETNDEVKVSKKVIRRRAISYLVAFHR